MITDDFTRAARTRIDAEADAKRLVGKAMRDAWTDYGEYTLLPEVLAPRIVEWARTHLTTQEPTEAEVEAAAIALCATGRNEDIWRFLEPEERDSFRADARAALSAARAARRDKEEDQ